MGNVSESIKGVLPTPVRRAIGRVRRKVNGDDLRFDLQCQIDELRELLDETKLKVDSLRKEDFDSHAQDARFLELYDYVFKKVAEEKVAAKKEKGSKK
ncbi:MAG: hypothetical protein LBL41_01755 [Bifidobacteriaceae bacterium]|jgi:hypothetical protein|nr:hypothetical protein [Bifidobacteriaceae bacterium]